jgi:hypothetical protein
MKKNVTIKMPQSSYDSYVKESTKADEIAAVATVATAALKLLTVIIDHKSKK